MTPDREEDTAPLRRLHSVIQQDFPLAAFMGVEPRSWSDAGLELWAPAGPSVNLHGTMFGGGIASLGILAGWGWLRLELEARGRSVPVVVQDARTTYARPIQSAYVALCLPPKAELLDRFFRALDRRGRGRIRLRVEIRPESDAVPVEFGNASRRPGPAPAAVVEARFAAVPNPRV
jgi:thioesterase domain-containing protein